MSFLATAFSKDLALTIYTLLGGLGIKKDVKTANNMGTCFCMQASDCVIIYLNENKSEVALATIYDTFLHINKQECYFHLFGRNKFFRL